MESDSISIAAKVEVARDVAKQSKVLSNLLAYTDETRQKEPIPLTQYEASTLDKVFEWCKEHSGADAAHKDFSMPVNFDNRHTRLELTPWQVDFFRRYDEYKWKLAVAANYLEVPYLYYSTCFAISKCLEGDEEVPESVPDDVLCNVLRFFSHNYINKWVPRQSPWEGVIKKYVRAMPRQVMRADVKGDKVKVSTQEVFDGRTKEVFDELESLRRHADENLYTFEDLHIRRFGEDERAAVQMFLGQPMSSTAMDPDTEGFIGFVEALYALWTRSLSIDLFKTLTDPLPLLAKIYEKFDSDAEIAPLRIVASVPRSGQMVANLQQFAAIRDFSGMTTGSAFWPACAYEKKRENDWKIAFDYAHERLTLEMKKVCGVANIDVNIPTRTPATQAFPEHRSAHCLLT